MIGIVNEIARYIKLSKRFAINKFPQLTETRTYGVERRLRVVSWRYSEIFCTPVYVEYLENLVDVTISELKPTSCKLTWKLTNHQRKEGVHYVIEKRYSIKTPLSDDQFSFWEYEGQVSEWKYQAR